MNASALLGPVLSGPPTFDLRLAGVRNHWLPVRKEALVLLSDAAHERVINRPFGFARSGACPGEGPDRSGSQDERKGWIMSVKLTDVQLVMLSAAAQREDLC